MSVQLLKVQPEGVYHCSLLYELLKERTPEQSISHKEMPTYTQHCQFVSSEPYRAWYLVQDDSITVGATYLTRNGEIGIAVFEEQRGKGYAEAAIKMLMERHDGPFLANINPKNGASIGLFRKLGFEILQETYSHE